MTNSLSLSEPPYQRCFQRAFNVFLIDALLLIILLLIAVAPQPQQHVVSDYYSAVLF